MANKCDAHDLAGAALDRLRTRISIQVRPRESEGEQFNLDFGRPRQPNPNSSEFSSFRGAKVEFSSPDPQLHA
jgi:hypothetical protein